MAYKPSEQGARGIQRWSRTFAEVSDDGLDGAPRLLRVRDVSRNDKNVRDVRRHALQRLLPPGHQRKAGTFLHVLVRKLLHAQLIPC